MQANSPQIFFLLNYKLEGSSGPKNRPSPLRFFLYFIFEIFENMPPSLPSPSPKAPLTYICTVIPFSTPELITVAIAYSKILPLLVSFSPIVQFPYLRILHLPSLPPTLPQVIPISISISTSFLSPHMPLCCRTFISPPYTIVMSHMWQQFLRFLFNNISFFCTIIGRVY